MEEKVKLYDRVLSGEWRNQKVEDAVFKQWVGEFKLVGMDYSHLMEQTTTENAINDYLVAFLNKRLETWEVPEVVIHLQRPDDKWKAMSAMQKAIRRSNQESAYKSVVAMINAGLVTTVWRRLAVTVLEDIGLADPLLCAMVVSLSTRTKVRKDLGDKKVLHYIVTKMCTAVKSRDLCDVILNAFLPNSMNEDFDLMKSMEPAEMLDLYESNPTFRNLYIATWRASGSKVKHADYQGRDHGDRKLLTTFLDVIGCPPLIAYLVTQGNAGSGELLGLPVPAVWKLMCESDYCVEAKDPYDNDYNPMIGSIYSATFDKHVLIGKRAFFMFMKMCPSIVDYMAKYGITSTYDKMSALERAIFYVEGAVLRPRMNFQDSELIYYDVLERKIHSNGFPDLNAALEFYKLVQSRLDKLHEARLKILSQSY